MDGGGGGFLVLWMLPSWKVWRSVRVREVKAQRIRDTAGKGSTRSPTREDEHHGGWKMKLLFVRGSIKMSFSWRFCTIPAPSRYSHVGMKCGEGMARAFKLRRFPSEESGDENADELWMRA